MSDTLPITFTTDEVRALKHGNDVMALARKRAEAEARTLKRKLLPGAEAERDHATGIYTVTFTLA